MGFRIPDIKIVLSALTEKGFTDSQARQIIQTCIKNHADIMTAFIDGDFSALPSVAASLGIEYGVNTPRDDQQERQQTPEKKAAKRSAEKTVKTSAIHPDVLPDKITADTSAARPDGFQALNKEDNAETLPDIIERVKADIDQPATLPEDFPDKIENTITNYMVKYHIDDMRKASAEEWRAACMFIGRRLIIPSMITIDKNKMMSLGVRTYSPDILNDLIDIWSFLCGTFKKVPLVSDFASFVGISHTYMYPTQGSKRLVTSSGIDISKKIQQIQEAGLASGLVDGRKNPTGTIFFLKNWHGWRDQREVVHTTAAAALDASGLPVLGDK